MQDLTHTLILRFRRMLRRRMTLANRARNDGDIELTRQSLIARQEFFRLGTGKDKILVLRHPGREVIFWKNGNVTTGAGGFANGSFCRGKVCGWVDGLRRERKDQQLVENNMGDESTMMVLLLVVLIKVGKRSISGERAAEQKSS